uniref:YopX family protein n=1 Tax=Streptococcus pluranimalium TaxID=82348 RepID=UPI003F694777
MIPKYRAFWKSEKKMITNISWIRFDKEDLIGKIEGQTILPIGFSEVILMQSTGLKDKNGVEIFEGDVVNAYDLDRDEGRIFKIVDLVGVVEYRGNSFCLKDDKGIYNDLWVNAERYEILGNIHQHQYLLEELGDG